MPCLRLRGHCCKLTTQRSRLEVRRNYNYFNSAKKTSGSLEVGIDSRATLSRHLLSSKYFRSAVLIHMYREKIHLVGVSIQVYEFLTCNSYIVSILN